MQDGAYADLADYIEYAEQFAPYDLILVDGRAHNHCIPKAFGLIKPERVLVLHDATGKAITSPLSAILIRFCSVDTVHMRVGYGLEAEESLFKKS